MLRPDRAAAVARQSGFWDSDALARCVLACGFDPDTYLDKNAGLREAGLDTQAALCHFLEHGYAEHRTAPTGPLPQGLDVLAGFPIPDRTYRQTLFKTLFLTQARHPRKRRTPMGGDR